MKRLLTIAITAAALVGRGDPTAPTISPYAPAQIIPASQKTAESKPPRRARPPHERRKEGAIPGLVTIPFGKTASGERTHIYRIMGQGGAVLDFTDYGARLVRAYLPDATGALADYAIGGRASVIDYEKANETAPVYKMTPLRRPRATGMVFEKETKETKETIGTKATIGTQATNDVALVASVACVSSRVVYLLDSDNRLICEYPVACSNLVQLATNAQMTVTRLTPETNEVQKVEYRFTGIRKL